MFKDKEIVELLKSIDKKLDIIVAIHKTEKIKQASRITKAGGKK
uniref:Uncharacterized protein n=1 Tax=virus sp. cti5L29 TaxID=2826813 RepID=A0A8S5R9D3_9VIRU|nr:MAG TPA: hypothetical protein [virus sp. cti5L29]